MKVTAIIVIGVTVVFVFILFMMFGPNTEENSVIDSNGILSCLDVRIDINKKELYINDKTYEAADIRGLRSEAPGDGRAYVYIDLKNVSYPSHKMTFKRKDTMDMFYQKFSVIFNLTYI